ncbi:SAV_2336 N-terminal domain-related protein [Streptomyces sp. KN37]|uniref:SAV_2336 N-terminal domain-related protein n=1 Tax=Streptomyces sp. KN37 TaxID=3090667 RepID=UPI002A759AEF|nr:SAV_2336 N-terminal domain-related protein [Streptomyces sp. KN37]WPO71454.1 SAV_2336 N-terminal domain-related protein [Streptomyces sp. KN37]
MTSAPHRADAVSEALAALVARLRDAELDPTVQELADSLWLARQVTAGGGAEEGSAVDPPPPVRPGGGAHDDAGLPHPHTPPAPAPRAAPRAVPRARLVVPGEGGDGERRDGVPVQVPTAAVLPDPLALQRALRPLQRYRPPVRPVPRDLDEQATAERAADTGLVVPVLRHARRREARLLLVMDLSTSTVVWEQALGELRHVCERAGAFREVQVQFLHEGEDGRPGYAATARPGAALQDPERLSDPTGSRLALVLSDCAGPMWRSGRMQRLLYRWGSLAPVAVVQPLPQRMWRRTHLPARRGHLHRREGPAGRLEFEPASGGGPRRRGIPVPVLALRRSSVEGWAKLVSGATGQCLEAAAGHAEAGHGPSGAPVRARQEVGGRERVRAFRRTASPAAWQLAVYLSAVPTILPVMQLVQRAMLAGSGPEVLAEVLLGGLLKRRERDEDPEVLGYEFLEGVEEELLGHLERDDALLLQKHCSDYLERRFGRSVHNFPATAVALLGDTGEPAGPPGAGTGADHPGLRAFAEVSGEVLRRFLPSTRAQGREPDRNDPEALREAAAEARERYGRERRARELDYAVELLETAAARCGGALLDGVLTDLGETLFLRWGARHGVADLHEALRLAAGVGDRSARARLLLGGTLIAVAEEVERSGPASAALPDAVREHAERLGGQGHLAGFWAEYLLLNNVTDVLSSVRAHVGDDAAHPGWPAQRALAGVLDRLAVVAARLVAAGVEVAGTGTRTRSRSGAQRGSRGGSPAAYARSGPDAPLSVKLVRQLTDEAAHRVAEQRRIDRGLGVTPMSDEDERQYARAVVAQLLEELARARPDAGRTPLDAETERRYADAVYAALYDARGTEGGEGGKTDGSVAEAHLRGVSITGPGGYAPPESPGPRAGRLDLADAAFHGSTLGRARADAGEHRSRDAGRGADAGRDRSAAEPRPQDVYVDFMRRAISTTGVLTLGPEQAAGYLQRGRLRKRLARHYTGRGEIPRDDLAGRSVPDASGVAVDACDDFREALARDGFDAAERTRAWLDLADALQLARADDPDEGGQRLILSAVDEALAAADGDHALILECHARGADVHWARYVSSGRDEYRHLAVERWEMALPLAPRDDPARALLLHRLGAALAQRGVDTHSAADTDAAVRHMREAVEATPTADPEFDGRRMHLATAYLARFEVQEVLADLYEADWLLGAVTRSLAAPDLAAYSWLRRGDVATRLAERTDALAQLRRADEYYRRAAETAAEAGYADLAAEAHHSRGETLEQLEEPELALLEYRKAEPHLPESPPPAVAVRAEELRAAIARLESRPGEA